MPAGVQTKTASLLAAYTNIPFWNTSNLVFITAFEKVKEFKNNSVTVFTCVGF
jgi:hypothetical protein